MVRLLTFVLLLQFGFHIHFIFNPNAIFYLGRESYYSKLPSADNGNGDTWIRYFANGLAQQFKIVERLADYKYLFDQVIKPSIENAANEKIIGNDEKTILLQMLRDDNINIYSFKAGDIKCFEDRRRTYLIKQLKVKNIIQPLRDNGREYCLNITSFSVHLFKQLRALEIVGID